MAEEAINNNSSVQEQWGQICSQLKVEVGETAFDSWLKPLTPGAFNDGIMNICVPTRFMRNWVITHYSDRIHKIWEKKNPAIKSVNFVVQAVQDESKGLYNPSCRSLLKKISSSPAPQNIYQSGLNSVLANSNEFQANTDQSLSVPLNPQYTFDNFVVGKTNEFAYAAARKVAESRNVSFNPLFLYSGVGLGKTHLMHAIAWHIKQQDPTRNIVYLSAEKFMYKFVRALRYKDTTAFKEQFRSVDVLMVDDVQFMGGKDTTQEEFFYTFNSLIEEGRQIIISDRRNRSPPEVAARLRSGRRHSSDRFRPAHRHSGKQGASAGNRAAAESFRISGQQNHFQHPRTGRRPAPRDCPFAAAERQGNHAGHDAGRSERYAAFV